MATGYIGKLKINNGNIQPIGSTLFGVCDTAAATAAKVVATTDATLGATFNVLLTGVTIHVQFTHGNSATSGLTLKIGEADAKSISNPGGSCAWSDGAVVSFTYDGTNWVCNDGTMASIQILNTYDGTSEAGISGKGVKAALETLDGDLNSTTPGAGKTLTAFSQTDGIVSAIFGNISITKSQVSDFSHSHGDINNDGTISTSPSYAVVTDNSNKIIAISLQVTDPTASGTSTTFIKTISQDSQGKITATKANLPTADTSTAGIIKIGTTSSDALAGNSSITIAGNTVNLASGSLSASTLRSSLGLTQALRFVGSTSTTMSDGYTGTPAGISIYDGTVVPTVGDVVLDSSNNAEYVCIDVTGTTYTWERLGRDSSWALDNDVIHNSLLTTAGDMIYASAANTPARLAIGTNGYILKVVSGIPTWSSLSSSDIGLGNVTNDAQIAKSIGTTAGDIIYWTAANTPTRLGIGTSGQVLTVNSDGIPSWTNNVASDEKVKQSPYSTAASSQKLFNLLFKHSDDDTEETAGIYYSTITDKKVTFDAYSGTLSAAKLSGELAWSNLTNVPTAATNTLGLVKTTSTVSSTSGLTAAPIINGVVYYQDTNDHYTANLYVTNSNSGTSLPISAVTNGNVYLRLIENSSNRGTFKISGGTGISVTAAATTGDISIDTRMTAISITVGSGESAPDEASSNDDIAFVHKGILYIKKFAS